MPMKKFFQQCLEVCITSLVIKTIIYHSLKNKPVILCFQVRFDNCNYNLKIVKMYVENEMNIVQL